MITGLHSAAQPLTVSFPSELKPLVSVVILAWRLDSQLLQCLASLMRSHDAPPYEVRLVLNGSTASVRDAVSSSVRGAKIIDLPANVGFGGGCNAGAAGASGDYLVFLNDDAIVSPDWLSTLIAAASGNDAVGAAASVLVNTDGTIQEAGSRVLASAGTVQFGKGVTESSARDAGFLIDREIDYGSGAALLVGRAAFELVAGFDPMFEPAYYEDADLCFRLRQAGFATWLIADARVVHLSGESTKDDRRFRQFASERSGSRFIERWKATLEHAPDANAPVSELSDPLRSPRVHPGAAVARSAESTALSLTIAYTQWLNDQLDSTEDALAAQTAVTAAAAAESRGWEASAQALRSRLADLDSRGPLGILKWKAGVAANHRNERRASNPS